MMIMDLVKIDLLTAMFMEILQLNPGNLYLTGSLALHHQKIKQRRQPEDIDIWMQHGTTFKRHPAMELLGTDSSRYPDNDCDLDAYLFNDIKVEIIYPRRTTPMHFTNAHHTKDRLRLPMIAAADICAMKFRYAAAETGSPLKHIFDLMFILNEWSYPVQIIRQHSQEEIRSASLDYIADKYFNKKADQLTDYELKYIESKQLPGYMAGGTFYQEHLLNAKFLNS